MIYVASDLHGCPLSDFTALLEKAGFSDDDYLFILGDVIDRGDCGVEILKWLMLMPNAELILGNHEAMLLASSFLFEKVTDDSVDDITEQQIKSFTLWQRNGASPTVKGLAECDPDTRADILDYLGSCPLFDTVSAGGRDFLLVHAGLGNFSEGKKIDEYTDFELLWARPEPYDVYSDNFTTVFGHTPTGYYGDRFAGKIMKTETWINVDCGVGRGYSPGLLRLDDLAEFYL